MLFTEAVQEVVLTTKRPDLISQARREINAAISFYCLDNNFDRDFVEQTIALNASEFTQSFAISSMTRFRKFKYLKRGKTTSYLERVSDAEMLNGCAAKDKYYIIGSNVNVSLKMLAATLDVGYYSFPPLLTGADTDNLNTFWLLDVSPYMLIERACAIMYRNIGDERSMQTHLTTARETYMATRKDLGISTQ